MKRSKEVEVRVGIFVFIGVMLTMLTILMLGGGTSFLQTKMLYRTEFPQIEGLVEGAVVKIAGVRVGQVTGIRLDDANGRVDVEFTVGNKFKDAVHKDSLVGIRTQGVLGDRYLVVTPGTVESGVAPDGTELKSEVPKELKDYLSTADEVLDRFRGSLVNLEDILSDFREDRRSELFFKNMTSLSSNLSNGSKDLKTSMDRLNSILTKIDSGQGTLGALVNDPGLYEDMKSLLGGANRSKVLKYFVKKSVEESREAAEQAEKKKKQK